MDENARLLLNIKNKRNKKPKNGNQAANKKVLLEYGVVLVGDIRYFVTNVHFYPKRSRNNAKDFGFTGESKEELLNRNSFIHEEEIRQI